MRGILRIAIAAIVLAGGLAVIAGEAGATPGTPVAWVQRVPVTDVVNGVQDDLDVLACASASRCWVASSSAVGGTNSPTFGNLSFAALNGRTLGAPVVATSAPHTFVSVMGCSATAYCVALAQSAGSADPQLILVDDGVVGAPIPVPDVDVLAAVDCVARSCTAVGARFTTTGIVQPVLVTLANGVLQTPVTVGIPSVDTDYYNSSAAAIDCVTTTSCVVAGSTAGTDGWITPVTNNVSGPSARTLKEHGNGSMGLACAAIDSCLLVGEGTQLYANGAIGPRLGLPAAVPGAFTDVTCVGGLHTCLAAEGQARPVVDGVPATAVPVSPDGKMLSVECFTDGCVGLESHFDAPSYSDPIAVLVGFTVSGGPADATAPTVTIAAPVDGAQLLGQQVLAADYTCDDGPTGSGVTSCTGSVDGVPVADGAPLPTSVAGSHTLTVSAQDASTNTSSRSATYSVLAGTATVAVTGGETVSTGSPASPTVPVQTSILVPAGTTGQVTARGQATAAGTPTPAGITLFAHQAVLTGPAATAGAPYRLTFTIDASDLGASLPADVEPVESGIRALACTDSTAAAPDPCVVSRTSDGSDAVVTVRSSHLSTWSFGVPAPLTVTTTSLVDAVPGQAYAGQLAASGGLVPYTWSLDSGTLPAGLTLSAAGAIGGSPTGTGSSSFTVRVTDGAAAGHTATKALQITVAPLAVGTASLPDARIQKAYTTTLTAVGGTGTKTWTISAGTLPAGLKLSTAGVLSGTPTVVGSFPVTVRVADTASHIGTRALTLTVVPMVVTTTAVANGLIGKAYTGKLVAEGGKGTLVWTAPSLPAGLKLSTAGALSGTPTVAGTFTFGVHVHDASTPSPFTADGSVTVTIDPMTIATASVPAGLVGKASTSTTFKTVGGKTAFTWTISAGALPAGLKLTTAGVLSGTPTTAGTFPFTVKVTDGTVPKAVATRAYSVTVGPMSITTASLADAHKGKAYSSKLVVLGGKSAYVWTVVGGTLPAGLKLSTAGTISGTPTATGSSTITVQVADASVPKTYATRTFTLNVLP